jgi:hypothetical protein
VELWAGITELQAGAPEVAVERFAASLAGARVSHPPGHPAIDGAACALCTAQVRTGKPAGSVEALEGDCRVYAAWGLVHTGLLAAAREALAQGSIATDGPPPAADGAPPRR